MWGGLKIHLNEFCCNWEKKKHLLDMSFIVYHMNEVSQLVPGGENLGHVLSPHNES